MPVSVCRGERAGNTPLEEKKRGVSATEGPVGDILLRVAYQESYLNTQSHFVHCLRRGEPAENDARDNKRVLGGEGPHNLVVKPAVQP